MSTMIHNTALVDPLAQIGESVEIGPYCVVGPNVRLGDGVRLISHVSITGNTSIGKNCVFHAFASIGEPPQDFKHKGGDVFIEIGERNVFREHVTVHPGTDAGLRKTIIGNDCYMMVGSHLAHDCVMGDRVVLSNKVQIGGFVTIGDHVILGGLSAVHQNTRLGAHAFIGGLTPVVADVIPYGTVMGNPSHLAGLNVIGLKRRGFDRQTIRDLRSAYRLLFAAEGTFKERLEDTARLYADHALVMQIVNFIKIHGKRNICMPNARN